MAAPATVLVADSFDERRRRLGLALYEGGYEVINAVNGEEALRFTAGLNPTLVIAHTGLEGMEPFDLHSRLAATGLDLPPFLVLCGTVPDEGEERPEGAFYFLPSGDLEPARFLHQVRLLLLARDIGGELSDSIDILYSDLTRIAIGDLLDVLHSYLITGHISFSVGPDPGIWIEDGEVIEAHWGEVTGRKAFHRISALRGGSFVVDLGRPDVERAIDVDRETLLAGAAEEQRELAELYARLPSLDSRLDVRMGDDFFAVEFTPLEREILTTLQRAKSFADLLDRVPQTDLEVVSTVEQLAERGFVGFAEPEHTVHVVTDSTSDLLPSLARRRRITVVPLSVLFGNRVFKDGIDIQPDEFYRRLQASELFPSTSPPGKGEFLEVYRRLIASGDILSIHISQKQSLTLQHAQEAATEGADELAILRRDSGTSGQPVIRVVDSRSNSVGLGLMALFASRMVSRGLEIEDVAVRLESIRDRLQFLFIVDTLEYLKKGGRIGKAQALIGTLLGIKPILGMKDGEVVPVDRVRGGRRVHPRIIELFRSKVDPGAPVFAALAHASAPKWAGRLKELLTGTFQVVEMHEGEIGPIVGAHTGPGTVGAILFQPTPEELELLAEE